MKKIIEPVKSVFTSRKFWFGKNEPVIDEQEHAQAVNMYFNTNGTAQVRRGWRFFGDMVHELWRINKIAQKSGLSSDIIVRIPLRGRKPIFKKTLRRST